MRHETDRGEVDPDLFVVATLVVSTIAAVGTWVQVLQARSRPQKELSREHAVTPLKNIETATGEARDALRGLVNVFEAQQHRVLGNSFDQRPRFGVFAPDFNAVEYQEFKHEIDRLETGLRTTRHWTRHLVAVSSKQRVPNESRIVEELDGLSDEMNAALFEDETFRDLIKRLSSCLERIERATEGARRADN